jgi:hypothetical protein
VRKFTGRRMPESAISERVEEVNMAKKASLTWIGRVDQVIVVVIRKLFSLDMRFVWTRRSERVVMSSWLLEARLC